MRSMGIRGLGRAMLVLAGSALLVAGCSSTPSGGGGGGGGGGASPTATAGASEGTILTASGSAGTYLTDYQGKALYLFVKDTGPSSTCTDTCATDWPPLTLTSTIPKAGPGVTQTLLSTFTRPDATPQIAYNRHPLYTYKGDTAPGDTKGQGLNSDGGLWYLVAPSGSPITT
jgi:predicted lipoprotein with Yx(FWY)xxD motif